MKLLLLKLTETDKISGLSEPAQQGTKTCYPWYLMTTDTLKGLLVSDTAGHWIHPYPITTKPKTVYLKILSNT